MKGRKPTLDNVVPMRGDAPKPVPAPPDLMSEAGKAVWEELAPELVRMDRLKPHYEHMLAAYCEWQTSNYAGVEELLEQVKCPLARN